MARQIVFTNSFFWKYSWAHLVMSVTQSRRWVMKCCLRARRPQASNKGFRPCPLRTEISPVSLNLLMMLCTVDDEIYNAFAISRWGTLFLKYSTIFLRTLSQIWEPLPIFTSERLCLSKGLFTPGHFMRFVWSDSYPIVKRPGVNALWNAFETDINPIAQTTSGGGWAAFQTKLDKCKCIWWLKPHM